MVAKLVRQRTQFTAVPHMGLRGETRAVQHGPFFTNLAVHDHSLLDGNAPLGRGAPFTASTYLVLNIVTKENLPVPFERIYSHDVMRKLVP